jgi:putative two-component system response regulator
MERKSAWPPDKEKGTSMSEQDLSTAKWNGDFIQFAKMKILIIDDEPLNVALLEALLSEHGYTRLRSISDSRIALKTCREFEPDLILLDLMMPPPDGFEILESLRAGTGRVYLPVIVLTADVNEETKRRALRAGATDFLLKPFDHLEVLLRIANLLETRRLHLQLDIERAAFEDAVFARTSELRETQLELRRAQNQFGETLQTAGEA